MVPRSVNKMSLQLQDSSSSLIGHNRSDNDTGRFLVGICSQYSLTCLAATFAQFQVAHYVCKGRFSSGDQNIQTT